MKHPRIEIFFNQVSVLWYWRVRAANGQIVAVGGEGYSSKSHVRRAVRRVERMFQFDSLEIVDVGR
jgi:hypothetical protein